MKLTKHNLSEKTNQVYDVIVVGGGAGGLSAGIYLQRYLLSSLIIDKGKARSLWMQELHNYLGLPPDTPGKTLLKQGKEHYLSLGGDLLNAYVACCVNCPTPKLSVMSYPVALRRDSSSKMSAIHEGLTLGETQVFIRPVPTLKKDGEFCLTFSLKSI